MIIGIVTARKGSKRIPNKSLTPLGGKALIEHTLEVAQHCAGLDRVFLTTDSQEIIDLARARYSKVEAPFVRPAALASDTASSLDVVNHLLTHVKTDLGVQPKAFVLFQPTSPFRRVSEVERAIGVFRKNKLQSLLGVVPVMHHPADYIWRGRRESGPFQEVLRRSPSTRGQDLPVVYFISGALFICDCDWFREKQCFYDPTSYLFEMSEETLLDIDTPFDLQLARGYLLGKNAPPV